jgi:hypothetical protein
MKAMEAFQSGQTGNVPSLQHALNLDFIAQVSKSKPSGF